MTESGIAFLVAFSWIPFRAQQESIMRREHNVSKISESEKVDSVSRSEAACIPSIHPWGAYQRVATSSLNAIKRSDIVALHKSIGNRDVAQLIRAKVAESSGMLRVGDEKSSGKRPLQAVDVGSSTETVHSMQNQASFIDGREPTLQRQDLSEAAPSPGGGGVSGSGEGGFRGAGGNAPDIAAPTEPAEATTLANVGPKSTPSKSELEEQMMGEGPTAVCRSIANQPMVNVLNIVEMLGLWEHPEAASNSRIALAINVVAQHAIDFGNLNWTVADGNDREAIWDYLRITLPNRIRLSAPSDPHEAFRLLIDLSMPDLIVVLMDVRGQGHLSTLASQGNVPRRLFAAMVAVQDLNLDALPLEERTLEHLPVADREPLQTIADIYRYPEDWNGMSPEGISKLRDDEGCKPFFYNDTNGYCTVGCGLVLSPQKPKSCAQHGLRVNQPYDGRLGDLEAKFQSRLRDAVSVVKQEARQPLTKWQHDALVNLAFQRNMGGFWVVKNGKVTDDPTFLGRVLASGRFDEVANALRAEGSGKDWRRRSEERAEQFESGRHP